MEDITKSKVLTAEEKKEYIKVIEVALKRHHKTLDEVNEKIKSGLAYPYDKNRRELIQKRYNYKVSIRRIEGLLERTSRGTLTEDDLKSINSYRSANTRFAIVNNDYLNFSRQQFLEDRRQVATSQALGSHFEPVVDESTSSGLCTTINLQQQDVRPRTCQYQFQPQMVGKAGLLQQQILNEIEVMRQELTSLKETQKMLVQAQQQLIANNQGRSDWNANQANEILQHLHCVYLQYSEDMKHYRTIAEEEQLRSNEILSGKISLNKSKIEEQQDFLEFLISKRPSYLENKLIQQEFSKVFFPNIDFPGLNAMQHQNHTEVNQALNQQTINYDD